MSESTNTRSASRRHTNGDRCFRKPLQLAALIILFGACTSCADLAAVAKFAASAKTAASGFSDIARDFSASAARRARYVRDEEQPIVLAQSQGFKAKEPAMLAAEKVLTDYISALAAISTDGAAGHEKPAEASKDDLQKIGFSLKQAGSGVALARKAAEALTAGYRSNKTGAVIHDCNPLLQDYVAGLKQIAVVDYTVLLSAERTSVEGYYTALLRRYGEKEPLAAVTIRQQMEQDLAGIARKQQAAADYGKILDDIAEGHQKLYDAGLHPSGKQLVGIVEPYAQDLTVQSIKFAKAF